MKTRTLLVGLLAVQICFADEIKPGDHVAKNKGLRGTVTSSQGPAPELHAISGTKFKVLAADANGVINVELDSGMIRVKVKAAADKRPIFNLKTRAAVMGVRGTDFVAIATPILGESEIVVLDGLVDFTSTSNPKDSQSIPKGHWGGIGGRFGSKPHELIALSPEQLQYFDLASTVK